jgi:hypothetical protein
VEIAQGRYFSTFLWNQTYIKSSSCIQLVSFIAFTYCLTCCVSITNPNNSSEFIKVVYFFEFEKNIRYYKMPKVKPVVSLFSQCIDCVCKFKCNIPLIPVNAKHFKTWTGSPWSIQLMVITDSESRISPFQTIRKLRWYQWHLLSFFNPNSNFSS